MQASRHAPHPAPLFHSKLAAVALLVLLLRSTVAGMRVPLSVAHRPAIAYGGVRYGRR
jgi:hypothetical protein